MLCYVDDRAALWRKMKRRCSKLWKQWDEGCFELKSFHFRNRELSYYSMSSSCWYLILLVPVFSNINNKNEKGNNANKCIEPMDISNSNLDLPTPFHNEFLFENPPLSNDLSCLSIWTFFEDVVPFGGISDLLW